ncbi:MAG: hypothetical protein NMNS01_02100 [Nitrosomonas sp.]|nr:MAG: hypothetical protein NMNS01_02100 [Nitrosomonas sp.]
MTGRYVWLWYVLAVSLGILTFQTTAAASELEVPGAHRNRVVETEGRSGVINRIDVENGQLVIDDLKYGFSPGQLIVRKGGHVSSLKALRPNQRVRYSNKSHAPRRVAGNRVISEIWIQ